MTVRTELQEVNKQIQHEFNSIHLLKTELACLTAPNRLTRLNNDYLKLKGAKVFQLIIDPMKDTKQIYIQKIFSFNLKRNNTRWRYKKGPSKYLAMLSKKK